MVPAAGRLERLRRIHSPPATMAMAGSPVSRMSLLKNGVAPMLVASKGRLNQILAAPVSAASNASTGNTASGLLPWTKAMPAEASAKASGSQPVSSVTAKAKDSEAMEATAKAAGAGARMSPGRRRVKISTSAGKPEGERKRCHAEKTVRFERRNPHIGDHQAENRNRSRAGCKPARRPWTPARRYATRPTTRPARQVPRREPRCGHRRPCRAERDRARCHPDGRCLAGRQARDPTPRQQPAP